MATRPLAISWKPHVEAYQWFVDHLRTDPDFRRVVRSFVTRVPGSSNDDNPPSPAMCPWVRLTPSPEAQYPIYTRPDRDYGVVHESIVTVQVETAAAGFSPADGMGLWDLIWNALNGPRMTWAAVASHQRVGINHFTLDQPTVIESAQPDSGSGLIYGNGTVRLYIRG